MGAQPELYAFKDVEQGLTTELRRYVLDQQNEALRRTDRFRVAVSGGSLPKILATALLLTSEDKADLTPEFSKWDIFYADERCVPLDHDDSNHKLIKEELLNKIPETLGVPKVYTIDEDTLNDPLETADQYGKHLINVFASRDSVKLPLFDLILLGCGPDGHTCSLFPNAEPPQPEGAWVLAVTDSPKPPPKRITLSLEVVTHAVKIAFVATGSGKKEIMKKILDDGDLSLPCAQVNHKAGNKVSWFCDTAAVEGVSFPRKSIVAVSSRV